MSDRVGLIDDPLFRKHEAGPAHPERPERLDALRRGVAEAGLEERLVLAPARDATREELLRVHGEAYLDALEGTRGRTQRLDPDTQAGPESCSAAVRAAGAVAGAVDLLLEGHLRRAFCAVRPPGHHAEAERAMGFCLLNNVAVGAAHALARGLERVLVIDFDVHHGNGTQAIFWTDPRVLYVSTHQFPFYPGTGSLGEVGEGPGRGFTVNLPLPAGCGDGEYVALYRGVVAPIARAFDAQLVLVSAGFDPHVDDPLAGMRVSGAGFGELAASCLEAASGAAQGRTLVVLEGGYHEGGIAQGAAAVLGRLLGDAAPRAFSPSPLGLTLATEYRRLYSRFWPLS